MASVYKHRKGWQASAWHKGDNLKKNFPSMAEAKKWAQATEVAMRLQHEPALGGPTKVTVAGMLYKYARLFTVQKKGCKSELDRINRYLEPANLPLLFQNKDDTGSKELIEMTSDQRDSALPAAFIAHRNARRNEREKTNVLRAELACTLVSSVSKDMLRVFIAQMVKDKLGGSTILKEMALLKHCFNIAISEWCWVDFKNPLVGMKLVKPSPARARIFAGDEEARLRHALGQCDNPFILPLVDFAQLSTARRGSLLKLTWRDINYENRFAMLYDTKGGHNVPVPLTKQAIEILKRLPRTDGEERVFPVSESAVKCAWNRACERAGITDFRFHDNRHVGATRHAKRVGDPHLLMQITGHKTITQLSRYVHLMSADVIDKLDATEPVSAAISLPPDNSENSVQSLVATNKAARLNARKVGAQQVTEVVELPTEVPLSMLLPANVFSLQARRAQSSKLVTTEPSPTPLRPSAVEAVDISGGGMV